MARGSFWFLFVPSLLLAGALWWALKTGGPLPIALSGLCFVITAFSFNFFRDPNRTPEIPQSLSGLSPDRLLLSPADGHVVIMRDTKDGEKVPILGGKGQLLSIFLSPLDVHVQRAPYPCRITEILYRPGTYVAAWHEKASEENEHSIVAMQGKAFSVVIKQIAGAVARRIVLWERPGKVLAAGERWVMIRFGSRVDLYAPAGTEWQVSIGQRVWGGRTVLGVVRERSH